MAQPPLADQLAALNVEQLEQRLRDFGCKLREPAADEFVPGFKQRRKAELLEQLVASYSQRPRTIVHSRAWPLSESRTAPLLAALRAMDWSENLRPQVPLQLETSPHSRKP